MPDRSGMLDIRAVHEVNTVRQERGASLISAREASTDAICSKGPPDDLYLVQANRAAEQNELSEPQAPPRGALGASLMVSAGPT